MNIYLKTFQYEMIVFYKSYDVDFMNFIIHNFILYCYVKNLSGPRVGEKDFGRCNGSSFFSSLASKHQDHQPFPEETFRVNENGAASLRFYSQSRE